MPGGASCLRLFLTLQALGIAVFLLSVGGNGNHPRDLFTKAQVL